MPATIRLKRAGGKKKLFFRIIVCDKRAPRDARAIEELGYYHPKTNPAKIEIKAERAKHWISVGAQPSATVKSILKKQKLL